MADRNISLHSVCVGCIMINETVLSVKAFAGMLVWLGALWGDYPVESTVPPQKIEIPKGWSTSTTQLMQPMIVCDTLWSGGSFHTNYVANYGDGYAVWNGFVVSNVYVQAPEDARDTHVYRIDGPGEGK